MKRLEWIMMWLFIVSYFPIKLVAQEHLDTLVKKCETKKMDGNVYVDVIYTKNEKTKKFEPTLSTLSIEFNPTLINEFLDAVKKDEELALEKTETKVAGKTYKLFYSFENADYTFYYEGKNGECTGIKIFRRIFKEENHSK